MVLNDTKVIPARLVCTRKTGGRVKALLVEPVEGNRWHALLDSSRKLRIDEDLRFEGWIHQDRGRLLTVRGTCHAGDTLTADAEGIFVRVDFEELQERMKERRDRS